MSIKDEAYKFHKKIWNSPNREEIEKVISKLKSSVRGLGNKIYPTPMLGLLIYDQQRLKKLANIDISKELASWSEREIKILFSVHNQVRHFNEQCLGPLAAKLPQAINAINPYKEYLSSIDIEGLEEPLFTRKDAEEIIKSFHSHPAFDVAISNLPSVDEHPLAYDQTILQLNSEIVEAGPGGKPQWVANYEQAKDWDHPNIGQLHHFGALISLYNSIANLDQFIYHGLFQDELLQVNRSHIIDYLWTTGAPGPSMWLMHIPFGYMYLFEVTDLIIINIDKPMERRGLGDTLCSIHTQIIPGSDIAPGILKMRMIDDNLNAYPYLIR